MRCDRDRLDVTEVLLIRHALADPVGRTIAGRAPGVHLNRIGRRQAGALAARLAKLPIAGVYTSPLERAHETAEPVAARLGTPVREAAGLIELDYGAWTGRAIAELDGDPVWRRFNTQRGTTRIPGGETMDEVVARGTEELRRVAEAHPGGLVAAVTHGDVIRALLAHYGGMPLDAMLRLEVAPASVSGIRLGPCPRVTAINWRADGLGESDYVEQ